MSAPTETDILLDGAGALDALHHEDIAYQAGYLDEDTYQRATGMPDWYLAGGEFTGDEAA